MFDHLREEISRYLTIHDVGVLSMHGDDGAYALPVRYHSSGLHITCLLPRWSDAAYYVEQPLPIVLVVPDTQDGSCWLNYAGEATALVEPASSVLCLEGLKPFQLERYQVAHLEPRRIDLIDERQGWGWRQTLECW